MRKRSLGKTGLVVSELALGTWGLSGDAYGAVAPDDAEAVVRRAVELGVTLFETADVYGAGSVEALLGRALGASSEVIVVTKGGTDRATEPPRKRFSREFLVLSVERSRRRLRRDRLEVYLLHNPSLECLRGGEATTALEELKSAGKIAHWGVAAGNIEVAREALDRGAELLSLAYSLICTADLHRLAGDVAVTQAGILARSTLHHGLLSGAWGKEREFPPGDHRAMRWTRPELERRIEQAAGLRFLAQGELSSLRAVALRWVLANHLVSSLVLGPKSVEQLDALVRDAGDGPRYLPDEVLRLVPHALEKAGLVT